MPPCDRLRSKNRCLTHSGCFWEEASRKCTSTTMPTVAPYTPGPPSASPIELAFGCVQEHGEREGEYEREGGHEGEGYYDGEGEGEAMAHSCVRVDPLFPGRKYSILEDCQAACTRMPRCNTLGSKVGCLTHFSCSWEEEPQRCRDARCADYGVADDCLAAAPCAWDDGTGTCAGTA
eukprot:gene12761-biopygen9483